MYNFFSTFNFGRFSNENDMRYDFWNFLFTKLYESDFRGSRDLLHYILDKMKNLSKTVLFLGLYILHILFTSLWFMLKRTLFLGMSVCCYTLPKEDPKNI